MVSNAVTTAAVHDRRTPRVTFVIWQAGRNADGGLQSISEMMGHAPDITPSVVTNLRDGPFTSRWRGRFRNVAVWPMAESAGTAHRSGAARTLGRIARSPMRLANNLRMVIHVLRHRIDIVHCNDRRAFWNAGPGARLAGARVILNVRDTPPARVRDIGLEWRLLLRLCDVFLVLSQEMVTTWRQVLRSESAKIRYIYSIVDLDRFSPVDHVARRALRASAAFAEATFVVVLVANFHPKKRQLEFLRWVAPEVMAQVPTAALVFLGDFDPSRDPYAAACRDAAREAGIADRVRFAGFAERVEDWYRLADVVVVASEREGLPRSIIEGIAAGAVVASVPVCSAREILERHGCGIVVDDVAPAALAAALIGLARDPARGEAMRRQGPGVARALFDAAVNGRSYSDLVRMVARP